MNPNEQADQVFDRLADTMLRKLERTLSNFDPDEVEADLGGDVLTLTLVGGRKIIINRHRAARQIWMAADRKAWHFNHQPSSGTWLSDKGGEELVATLTQVLSEQLRRAITLSL